MAKKQHMFGCASALSLTISINPALAESGDLAFGGDELMLPEAPLTAVQLSEARGGFSVGGIDFDIAVNIQPVVIEPIEHPFADGGPLPEDGVFGEGGVFGDGNGPLPEGGAFGEGGVFGADETPADAAAAAATEVASAVATVAAAIASPSDASSDAATTTGANTNAPASNTSAAPTSFAPAPEAAQSNAPTTTAPDTAPNVALTTPANDAASTASTSPNATPTGGNAAMPNSSAAPTQPQTADHNHNVSAPTGGAPISTDASAANAPTAKANADLGTITTTLTPKPTETLSSNNGAPKQDAPTTTATPSQQATLPGGVTAENPKGDENVGFSFGMSSDVEDKAKGLLMTSGVPQIILNNTRDNVRFVQDIDINVTASNFEFRMGLTMANNVTAASMTNFSFLGALRN